MQGLEGKCLDVNPGVFLFDNGTTRQLCCDIPFVYYLQEGPDHIGGVKDASTSRQCCNTSGRMLGTRVIRELYTFTSSPQIQPGSPNSHDGSQINALYPFSLYQYRANKEYEPACTLAQYVGEL